MAKDYYEVLGIQRGSSEADIKSAYRKLALKYHPDRNPNNKAAEETFKEISEAYAVLSDSQKKAQYDQFGASGFHQKYSSEDIFRGTDFNKVFREFGFGGDGGGASGGFDDILASLFGGGGRGGFSRAGAGARAPSRGSDVDYPLNVEFLEAYKGGERTISFRLNDPDQTQRELSVRIPAGVKSGTKLRIPGRGAPASHPSLPAGDLYVTITVNDHPVFRRVGDDIEVPLSLKISEAILGATATVVTPQGEKSLKVPSAVSGGTKIRMRGLGFQSQDGQRGDLFAVVKISIPDQLSAAQKKLVDELQSAGL